LHYHSAKRNDQLSANQIVYLPAGTYRINGCVFNANRSNITLRGAGMGKTILDLHGGRLVTASSTSAVRTGRSLMQLSRFKAERQREARASFVIDLQA
jgi:hypothetical protein